MIDQLQRVCILCGVLHALSLTMVYGIQDKFPPGGSGYQPMQGGGAGQQVWSQNSQYPAAPMATGGGYPVASPANGPAPQYQSTQYPQRLPTVQQGQQGQVNRQRQYLGSSQMGGQLPQPVYQGTGGTTNYTGGQQPQRTQGRAGPVEYVQQQPQSQQNRTNLDSLMQMERQDLGIAAKSQLHSGPMHGPTPSSIPGGQVITTKGLLSLVDAKASPYLLFDVLGGPETLPGAINAVIAHQAGSFEDSIQQQFGQYLQQLSKGNREIPLVFYCQSVHCWMSYNAALRAIKLGYRNVLWYRGGIEAWKAAGRKVAFAQQNY